MYTMSSWISIIIFVYIIYSNFSLSRRVRYLESEIKNRSNLSTQNAPVPPVLNMTENIVKNDSDKSVVMPSSLNKNTEYQDSRFILWLKEDWLMKLGAALFIIGFGWFVSYAFANNWVGPLGRISIGILAGVMVMMFGFWRMMKYPTQGALFMGLGAGMTMITIFAGRSLYGFFTPSLAVVFDFIIVSFISFASYKFNLKNLAFGAQVLAFVTPLLVAGETNTVFLFSYLMFISLATLFLASITGWRDLISASLIFVGLYSVPNMSPSNPDASILLNFAFGFGFIYLVSGMLAVINKGVKNKNNEILLAVLNGLFLFLWIYNVAPPEWTVLLYAFWAVVFTMVSFAVFYITKELVPFYSYGGVAVAFIGAATAAQLHGPALTIAFIIEIALMLMAIILLTKETKIAAESSVLFVIPGVLSLASFSNYSYSQVVFNQDFAVLIMMALALIFSGRLIGDLLKQQNSSDHEVVTYSSSLIVAGSVYAGYLIWQFFHILMPLNPDMATMLSLCIFTILGLSAYFAGLYGGDMARRTYGAGLLGFVVFRLIFVDVWNMELFGRVVTFLAIGVLLMSTAFLSKNKKVV